MILLDVIYTNVNISNATRVVGDNVMTLLSNTVLLTLSFRTGRASCRKSGKKTKIYVHKFA